MEIRTGHRYFVGDKAAEVVEIQKIHEETVTVNLLASGETISYRKEHIENAFEKGSWIDPLSQNA